MSKEEVKVWWAIAVIVFSLASCQTIRIREEQKTRREAMEKGYNYESGGFQMKFEED